MSISKYKKAREATKMTLGIALHQTRQEMGGLSIEGVSEVVKEVWHVSDIEALVVQLQKRIEEVNASQK